MAEATGRDDQARAECHDFRAHSSHADWPIPEVAAAREAVARLAAPWSR